MKTIRSFSLVALTTLSIATGAAANNQQLSSFGAFKAAVGKHVATAKNAVCDTWAEMPSKKQMGVMVSNAANQAWFDLTAQGGYVRKNPKTVALTLTAAAAVASAIYYAYSNGYFGKAYNAIKAPFAQKN